MNMHLIWGVIVVFGSYFTRADVHELKVNERAYLPPDNKLTKVNEEYLPPTEKEVKEVVNSQCNLPMIVYNGPPPVKVKTKLNNEYLPPSKEQEKVLVTTVNKQPKIANDPVPISPKLQQKHFIQGSKTKQTKVLDNNNATIKPKQSTNREYLPPSNDDRHSKAITPGYQHNQPKAIPDPLPISRQLTKTMNGSSYQHNQPKAIDDPLPVKVNYIQPLRLDFLDGQLKPITKGPLFTGLFLNASEIKLSTERIPKKIRFNQTKPAEVKQNNLQKKPTSIGKEAVSQTKVVNHELKAEHSLQNTKYHKKFEDDIVLINYPDATTNFKLFNSDDDTLLSGSAPEVIFRPGDDISFVHDMSVIDDYEHVPAKDKKADTSLTTTTTTSTTSTTPIPLYLETYTTQDHDQDAESALEQKQSNETENNVTDHGYAYEKPKYESIHEQTTEAWRKQAVKQDAHSAVEQGQSNETESNVTDHGYSYEKPKYESIQEQTTEALRKQAVEQDAHSAVEQGQSNETESSVTDHGYSYKKPKYESIQEQTTEALRRQADKQDAHSAVEQGQSNETENNVTDHGYSYEKPKLESIQEHTTEAMRRQADDCDITDMEQLNKPHNSEQTIKEDNARSAEHQSNENDHSHTGAGYFYEKPKIPFDF